MDKFLFIADSLPCPQFNDGARLRVFNLLKEFSKNFAVTYIYIGNTCSDSDVLESMSFFSENNIVFHGSVFYSGNLYTSTFFGYSREIGEKLNNLKSLFKFIFIEGFYSYRYYKFFARKFNPNSLIFSGVDCLTLASYRQLKIPGKNLKYYFYNFLRYFYRYFYEKFLLSSLRKVYFVSLDDAIYFKKLSGVETLVCPNGVDLEFFSFKRDQLINTKKILFTGILRSSMNERAALDVIDAVRKSSDKYSAVIAGKDVTKEIFLASQNSQIVIIDSPSDIRVAFSERCLYVAPIFYGTGIKNNVLQALAMGFPVITTKIVADPIGLIHGKNCLIFNSQIELIDVLSKIQNFDLNSIAINGYQHVARNFSWANVSSKYLDFKS